jgi:hypothetical protein
MTPQNNIWLVFHTDDEKHDACTVYYSWLVVAKNKKSTLVVCAEEMNSDITNFDGIVPEIYYEKKAATMIQPYDNIWLVFYKYEGDHEDCNVHYSWLVVAKSKESALKISVKKMGEDSEKFDIIKPEIYYEKSKKSEDSD